MLDPMLALATYIKNLRDVSRLMPTLPPAARGLAQALMGLAVFALKILVLMLAVYDLIDMLMTVGKTMVGLAFGFLRWVKGFGKGLLHLGKLCSRGWKKCLSIRGRLPDMPKACIGSIAATSVTVMALTSDLSWDRGDTGEFVMEVGATALDCAGFDRKARPNVGFVDTVGDSTKLGKNMRDAGNFPPEGGHAAHHIIPGNHPKAKPAHKILTEHCQTSINDAMNGVWLPHNWDSPNSAGRTVHMGPLHSNR